MKNYRKNILINLLVFFIGEIVNDFLCFFYRDIYINIKRVIG